MKYFLCCILLIAGCKSSKYVGNSIVVIGIAIDVKGGSVLRANGNSYRIEGLQHWDSIYLGNKVKVKGQLVLIEQRDTVSHDEGINPFVYTLQSQTVPRYYVIKDATWELYNSIRK